MIYVDTSALAKLVWREAETPALEAYLDDRPDVRLVSSALLAIEVRRAALRQRQPQLPRADLVLARVTQVTITEPIVESASRLPGPSLRSLDAIHLATALLLKPELDAFLSYDKRLAEVVAGHAIPVVAPS